MDGRPDVAVLSRPAQHRRADVCVSPAYLLSFLIDAEGEPIAGAVDLPLLTRSRMPAVFGLSIAPISFKEETAAELAGEIQQYKRYRGTIAVTNATLLTLQTPYDESGWDVLQEVAEHGCNVLIFGFRSDA